MIEIDEFFPCAHCGGKPKGFILHGKDGNDKCYIQCPKCGMRTAQFPVLDFDHLEGTYNDIAYKYIYAITAWNNRHPYCDALEPYPLQFYDIDDNGHAIRDIPVDEHQANDGQAFVDCVYMLVEALSARLRLGKYSELTDVDAVNAFTNVCHNIMEHKPIHFTTYEHTNEWEDEDEQ